MTTTDEGPELYWGIFKRSGIFTYRRVCIIYFQTGLSVEIFTLNPPQHEDILAMTATEGPALYWCIFTYRRVFIIYLQAGLSVEYLSLNPPLGQPEDILAMTTTEGPELYRGVLILEG